MSQSFTPGMDNPISRMTGKLVFITEKDRPLVLGELKQANFDLFYVQQEITHHVQLAFTTDEVKAISLRDYMNTIAIRRNSPED